MIHGAKTKQTGYTLVEVLVVLFIISIVTSVALLSIRQNENKEMESFANELTQIVSLAEEQAMLTPSVLGLSFGDQSFHFTSLQASRDGKKDAWAPLSDAVLGSHKIPANFEVSVKTGGQQAANKGPQIVISTDGEMTPFVIYIGKRGKKPRYVISGDADGTVTNKFLS